MTSAADMVLGITPQKQQEEQPRFNAADAVLGVGNPGFVGGHPVNSVMTELGEQKESAGFFTHLVAGLADDPETQMRVYAKSRFPDVPIKESLKRYGIHNGNVVYVDNDGTLRPETADTWYQNVKEFAAKTGSHAPSIAMSIIGSVGGPGMAAVGAFGGEGIRKSIAATALEEPQTTMGNLQSMSVEGALGAGGDLVGRGLGAGVKQISKFRGGKLARQAGVGSEYIDPKRVAEMEKLGQEYGIDLFAPQTSGSRRLADKFNLLGDLESSSPIIQKARETQSAQIDDAIQKYIDGISKTKGTPYVTGNKLSVAAEKSIQDMVNVRKAKADPVYKKALDSNTVVDVSPVVSFIESEMKTAKGDILFALRKAKKLLLNPDMPKKGGMKLLNRDGEFVEHAKWDSSLKGLHGTKIALDAAKERSKQGNVRWVYKEVKELLLKQMDEASPDYAKARKIFSDESTEIAKQSNKTILGELSKLDGDRVVAGIKKIFNSSPEAINRVKGVIRKQNPDLWDEAVATYLTDVFETSKENITGNIVNRGGDFFRKLWADQKQRKILMASLSREQYGNMINFMKVLKTSGIILKKESATATRQQMMEEMGAGRMITNTVRAATRPLVTKEKIIGDKLLEIVLNKNARELAKKLISPTGATELKKMVYIGEKPQVVLPMLTNFLGQIVGGEAMRQLQEDVTPEILGEENGKRN